MGADIERGKAYRPLEGFVPNPKLRLLDQVSEVMRFKHYSIRTERTYREWIKRFILFHGKRHPREMGAPEVERFLSDLAVKRQVAASTQSQGFNALLFLYRDVRIGVRFSMFPFCLRWRAPLLFCCAWG